MWLDSGLVRCRKEETSIQFGLKDHRDIKVSYAVIT